MSDPSRLHVQVRTADGPICASATAGLDSASRRTSGQLDRDELDTRSRRRALPSRPASSANRSPVANRIAPKKSRRRSAGTNAPATNTGLIRPWTSATSIRSMTSRCLDKIDCCAFDRVARFLDERHQARRPLRDGRQLLASRVLRRAPGTGLSRSGPTAARWLRPRRVANPATDQELHPSAGVHACILARLVHALARARAVAIAAEACLRCECGSARRRLGMFPTKGSRANLALDRHRRRCCVGRSWLLWPGTPL
jgi:hypothetical protein